MGTYFLEKVQHWGKDMRTEPRLTLLQSDDLRVHKSRLSSAARLNNRSTKGICGRMISSPLLSAFNPKVLKVKFKVLHGSVLEFGLPGCIPSV